MQINLMTQTWTGIQQNKQKKCLSEGEIWRQWHPLKTHHFAIYLEEAAYLICHLFSKQCQDYHKHLHYCAPTQNYFICPRSQGRQSFLYQVSEPLLPQLPLRTETTNLLFASLYLAVHRFIFPSPVRKEDDTDTAGGEQGWEALHGVLHINTSWFKGCRRGKSNSSLIVCLLKKSPLPLGSHPFFGWIEKAHLLEVFFTSFGS